MLKRRPDWSEKLYAAVDTAKLIPFQYGLHDCCLWAAHCVDAMCDTDLTRQIVDRFNYADEDSAARVIEAGGGLLQLVTEFMGEPMSAKFAAPGDVVLARGQDERPIVGVVVGHHIVAPGPEGVIALPYGSGVVAWRV